MSHRLAVIFFRALFSVMGWIIWALPGRLRLCFGSGLGCLLGFFGFRKTVISENLRRACEAQSSIGTPTKLLKEAYSHLGNLILEFFLVFGPMKKFIIGFTNVIGFEHWDAAKKEGRGVLLLANHVGNWEIMGGVVLLSRAQEILFVTKRLKPKWFHELVETSRARYKVMGTYEPRTLKDVLKALKENRTVGIVHDQYVGPPTGVRVPFFGIPVGTSRVVASLAKRTEATVLPVVNYRNPDGSYTVEIRPPIKWIKNSNPDLEIALNTAEFSQFVEADVKEHPSQWLWSHRRFKGDLTALKQGEWETGRARK